MGELRQRRRIALPVLAGLGGMAVPVGIFVAANAGHPSAHGWGVAMSTDTAFALGMLALVGPRFPDRLRAFMLTVVVVDDVLALIVIATVYSGHLALTALLIALALVGATLVVRQVGVRYGLVYAALGVVTWVAVFKSGIDPVVVGLVMGLLAYAYPAARVTSNGRPISSGSSASSRLPSSNEPRARTSVGDLAKRTAAAALSPVDELRDRAALCARQCGDRDQRRVSSLTRTARPITLGILIGYVVGKPVGIAGDCLGRNEAERWAIAPPVGWVAVTGAGAIAGSASRVSLLIADHAFGASSWRKRSSACCRQRSSPSVATWLVFSRRREAAPAAAHSRVARYAEPIIDLAEPVEEPSATTSVGRRSRG